MNDEVREEMWMQVMGVVSMLGDQAGMKGEFSDQREIFGIIGKVSSNPLPDQASVTPRIPTGSIMH